MVKKMIRAKGSTVGSEDSSAGAGGDGSARSARHASDASDAAADSIGSRFAKGAAGLLDSDVAASVKESAQQIWLAGMGAFAKAQAEGGKVFEALVREGVTLQKKTQGIAEETLGDVSSRMGAMADTVAAKAGQNWDKLESIFEQRTAKALGKLGVPTADDLDALAARVSALEQVVARMAKAPDAKRAATTGSRTPARTASNAGSKAPTDIAAETSARTAAKPVGNGAAKTAAAKAAATPGSGAPPRPPRKRAAI